MTLISPLTEVARFLARPQGLRIGGREQATDTALRVLNPSTGGHLATAAAVGVAEVDLADLIEDSAAVLGQLDALDNGKPVATARDVDAMWSARHLRYFAGWPDEIEGLTIPVNIPDRLVYTRTEPLGDCGLICPWNYPLLMAMWKLAPALAAGNTVVLKPSEETPLSSLYLADLALQAGMPPGVLNVIPGTGPAAGAALAAHPGVAKIGFTGSTETGRRIVEASVGNLKRVSLELGGKAANIILADADLDRSIPGAFWAAFGNNGQSCTAGARLYVQASLHDRVVDRLAAMARGLSVGPGMDDPRHNLGPAISEHQRQKVLGFMDQGTPITGGGRLGDHGWFVAPTILSGVTDGMRVAQEEVFGPVLPVLTFTDDADVLARANATPYGLAAGLWGRDVTRVRQLADRLQAGTVWVNCWGETDAAAPFGGMKQSGYGREMGREAVAPYSQTKCVWMA